MRVCAFGSFDTAFDRSWILLDALKETGVEITTCHFDLWRGYRHKTGLFPWRWLRLAGRYLWGLLTISRQFVRSPRSDVLYVGYMGHLDLLVAYVLNRRRRSTLVFDPCISLYSTLVEDRQLVKATGPAAALIRRLDTLPCRLADVVVTDTDAHAAYFADVLGVERRRIHRVFVGAAEPWRRARWAPGGDPALRVLFYAKFSPLHGLPVILEAAERLEGRDVRFTIVGGGQLEGLLRAALDRTPAPAVEWIPWLEPDALIERTRGCHVCLGIFGDTAKAAMVIPNKVFQAMAMGVPVVTRDSPAIRELVDAGAAVLCAATGAALAEAIAALDRDRSRLAAIGEAGRRAFETRAGTSALVQQFHEAIGGR